MILKILSDDEVQIFRTRFRFFTTETSFTVFDTDKLTLKKFELGKAVTLQNPETGKNIRISRYAIDAWRTRFSKVADIFEVQNAITRARLNGIPATDLDGIEKYL